MEGATVQDEVHFLVVQAQLVQDCRLQIGDVVGAFYGLVADLVGGAFDDSAFNASSG